jgi:DNA-binding IclR family transcriptional regulator
MSDQKASDSRGVNVLSRALQLLDCFRVDDTFVSLAELGRRTKIHKTTVLRLARTLAASRYLVQREEDGAWRLGPAAGWLGARYQASFDVTDAIEPVLRALTQSTNESASFFVREGNIRTCLFRVEGPQSIRHHIRQGEVLPLEKGSPGRVLLAYCGEQGDLYEDIRKKGYYVSIGERDPQIASVSAPVFGSNWRLLGVISVSGPSGRLSKQKLGQFSKLVISKATELSYELSGGTRSQSLQKTFWHP